MYLTKVREKNVNVNTDHVASTTTHVVESSDSHQWERIPQKGCSVRSKMARRLFSILVSSSQEYSWKDGDTTLAAVLAATLTGLTATDAAEVVTSAAVLMEQVTVSMGIYLSTVRTCIHFVEVILWAESFVLRFSIAHPVVTFCERGNCFDDALSDPLPPTTTLLALLDRRHDYTSWVLLRTVVQ